MSALDKQYVIKLDLNKETYNEDMEFSISDLETSDFWIDIKKSRKTIDFTDFNVVLYITKPNGNIRTLDAVFDMENKMYYCNLTTETKNLLGDYEIQVIVNNFDENERLVVPSRIKYHVVNDILHDTYENIEEIEDTLKENYDALLYDLENAKIKNATQDGRLNELEWSDTTQNEKLISLENYSYRQDERFANIERVNTEQTTAINNIRQVNDEQDTQIRDLSQGLDELTSQLNGDVGDIRNAITEINNELDEINNELDENDSVLEDLTDISIQNTLGINSLEKQYEEKFLEIEQQISEYTSTTNSRLTNVESKNTTQDSRINSVENKYTSLNNVVDTVKVVNSNQTIEINNLKNRVTALEQKISELETLVTTLKGGEE